MSVMRKREYREALETLGLTQKKMAELVAVDERTSRRFALGERKVPRTITLLLRLMIKYKITPEEVEELQ